MKKLTLSIPEPCHEKWSSFTPTSKGAFCGSCQKEVIDFTSWSDERIAHHFTNATNTCGRFHAGQLKVYEVNKPKRSRLQVFASVVFVTVLSLLWQRPTQAQSKEKQSALTEQRVGDTVVYKGKPSVALPVVVKGVVRDEDGSVVPGVNVIRKGTVEGTVTNVSGEFELTLVNPRGNEVIVFSFIGMVTKEIPIASLNNVVNFPLNMEATIVAEPVEMVTAVAGGLTVTRVDVLHRLSPRRLWGMVKQIFTPKSKSTCDQPQVVAATSVAKEKDIIEDISPRAAVCYPNPTTDKINVSLPGEATERFISICTLQGQVIEERISERSEEQFDVSGMVAGIYIVKIEAAGESRWVRVVKR